MSVDELGRIKGDLAVMQRAMGLHIYFGTGMLVFGIVLTIAAVGAAVVSLLLENDLLQTAPFAAIVVLCPVGLFLRTRRSRGAVRMNRGPAPASRQQRECAAEQASKPASQSSISTPQDLSCSNH